MRSFLAQRHKNQKKGLLTQRASKTFEYLYDGFIDPNVICMFDAKAVYTVPQEATIHIANSNEPTNYYTSIGGEPELLQALSRLAAHNDLGFTEPENILITAGAINGFSAVCSALCDPNDVILALSPSYILLAHSPELFGATMELVSSNRNGKFRVNPIDLQDTIERLLSARKTIKAVTIVNPTNIDGQCWTTAEIDALAPILQRYDLLLIEDRVYDGTQFAAPSDASFFGAHPDLKRRTITIDSISKRFGATQWRVGWVFADSAIIEAAREFVMQSVWSPNSLFQRATATMISSLLDNSKHSWASSYLHNTQSEYKRRRDLCYLLIDGLGSYIRRFEESRQTMHPFTSPEELCTHYATELKHCELLKRGCIFISAPVVPQAAMFLLIDFAQSVWDSLHHGLEHPDLSLARLIYLNEGVVMLPPSELTLPQQDKLFRIEYGVAVADIVSCFERLDRITQQLVSNQSAGVLPPMLPDTL